MNFAVLKGASYCLVHAPELLQQVGTTVAVARAAQPAAPFLAALPQGLRSFGAAVAYPPNQTYIGNLRPEDLARRPRPWHAAGDPGARPAPRHGPFGEIMPEEEFFGLLQLADAFELVRLEAGFAQAVRERLAAHPLLGIAAARLGAGLPAAELLPRVAEGAAVPLHWSGRLAGIVLRAHPQDPVLTADVMVENLAAKASAWLAAVHLFRQTGLAPEQVDYVIECSESACGDMNQRGGGNFAKAIAELAGCGRATGADLRAFCAAPVHSIVAAAGMIQAGIHRHVLVVAGGATAKLGMNAREHLARGLPVLEDTLGAFAVLLGPEDGLSPVVRTDLLGRLPVGAGASPQAVMTSLVVEPLARAGLRLTDVERYASELHDPEVTEPAGAGDVPRANYRMIAALAVRQGALDRAGIDDFVQAHGVPGFAPTQGHIPSGVPYIGHALSAMRAGTLRRAMIIGKGSLFLGRMTNLFDGLSFVLEGRAGPMPAALRTGSDRRRIGLTLGAYELGAAEAVRGAELAQAEHPELAVVLIGEPGRRTALPVVPAADPEAARTALENLLASGELAAAVTAHHAFPMGIATVARCRAAGSHRPLLLATTTGASSPDRVTALVRNAVYGLAVGRALGWSRPTLGLLNLDGAVAALARLQELAGRGYPIRWANSVRAEGGPLLRGNDFLAGAADVLVADTLTGNLLVKLLAAQGSGGRVEAAGEGYGPGVGPGMAGIVCIVSRAAAAGVMAAAIGLAAELSRGDLDQAVAAELAGAAAAGLEEATLGGFVGRPAAGMAPGSAPLTGAATPGVRGETGSLVREILGVDVLRLEEAADYLVARQVPARAGMGCTGPVILVAPHQEAVAVAALQAGGFLCA